MNIDSACHRVTSLIHARENSLLLRLTAHHFALGRIVPRANIQINFVLFVKFLAEILIDRNGKESGSNKIQSDRCL